MTPWSIDNLKPSAVSVSASRRTDIPTFFGQWFARRLEEGFADYIPAGPPRRVRRSLRPEDVTHFNFWTKWPRPFFPTLDKVLAAGFPVLWNVTITGLGGTGVEPHVPATERAVESLLELSRMVPAKAILWRYDPVFISERYPLDHHIRAFTDLTERLQGKVDRVACSFITEYGRRVKPDLKRYQSETSDAIPELPFSEKTEIMGRLREISEAAGIPFTLCCQPELQQALACQPTGCNSWSWACRVYPELKLRKPLKNQPCREGCACSKEIDIGCYDTCALGCRYSYGSCNTARARENLKRHDPESACIIP